MRSSAPTPSSGPKAERPQKSCGCSGVRWCAGCQSADVRAAFKMRPPEPRPAFLERRPLENDPWIETFDSATQSASGFSGLCLVPDALTENEAARLLAEIERWPFSPAQSGKRKQHFGAKANFNKRKINPARFAGLPSYALVLEEKLKRAFAALPAASAAEASQRKEALLRFETTDVFVLRYAETDQSNLDFHLDDEYAYGEGIIDLSLESDSVLTFIRRDAPDEEPAACVRAPLPARSAAFLFGAARYEWEHAILPYDIEGQRTSLTFRTLGPQLRETDAGRRILQIARSGSPLRPPD